MIRKIVTASLVVLGLALIARADDVKPLEKTADKPVTVPFELLKTGHLAVNVKVNGKGPYLVIFDTGSPMTFFNNKLAKEAGLVPADSKPNLLLLKTKEPVTMQVGELKAEKVSPMVMNHPLIEALGTGLGKPLYGIVGFPFFARYKTTLDYQKKEMVFAPTEYKPASVLTEVFKMVSEGGKKPEPTILAPAAQWGLVIAPKAKDDDEAGVTIREVMPGSPAAKAGLKADDRLLTLDGRWTDTRDDVYTAVSYVKPGTTAKVVVKRGKDEKTLTVKPVSGL